MSLALRAWKILIGVKDALVLIFMLIFFAVLYAVLSGRSDKHVGEGALLLKLNGVVVEQPAPNSLSDAFSSRAPTRQFRVRDITRALEGAADDDRVKAVVLDLDGFMGAGHVSSDEIGAALDKVRAKKPVHAFATAYTDGSYALAAHASDIAMSPMGEVAFAGPGGSNLYYKGLMDKLGVNAHIYRVGKFKSAVEPFLRADQSPEAKQEYRTLVDALWQDWLKHVQAARPKARIAALAADPVGMMGSGDMAQAALSNGLIDRLIDRDAFDRDIGKAVGTGKHDMGYKTIPLATYVADYEGKHNETRGDDSADIGIATVAGTIVDGKAPAGTAGGETIATLINTAVERGRIKALVLRVDSGGGSALASERIRAALANAKAKGLPVVVSMGNVAASGGYWVTTAADKIFAEPATITGSIGVFGIIPTFEHGFGKIGVTADGVKTTPLSGQPDIAGGTSPEFDQLVQRGVENIYARFLSLVGAARKLPVERVNEIGQGRVWDGGTAHQLQLVDAFGSVDDAIADAATRAKLDPKDASVVWLEEPRTLADSLADTFAGPGDASDSGADDMIAVLARRQQAQLATAVSDLRLMTQAGSVQARCLSCPATATSRVPPNDTLLTLLLNWIAS